MIPLRLLSRPFGSIVAGGFPSLKYTLCGKKKKTLFALFGKLHDDLRSQ
jgi:hypothetical protein